MFETSRHKCLTTTYFTFQYYAHWLWCVMLQLGYSVLFPLASILIVLWLTFVHNDSTDHNWALIHVMACSWTDAKSLTDPMLAQIYITMWRHWAAMKIDQDSHDSTQNNQYNPNKTKHRKTKPWPHFMAYISFTKESDVGCFILVWHFALVVWFIKLYAAWNWTHSIVKRTTCYHLPDNKTTIVRHFFQS